MAGNKMGLNPRRKQAAGFRVAVYNTTQVS